MPGMLINKIIKSSDALIVSELFYCLKLQFDKTLYIVRDIYKCLDKHHI